MNDFRWLTKESQAFLDRGYLKGFSVEERTWVIAAEIQKRTGIEGYAEKFVEYYKKGWFSLSTPIQANFATSNGLPISCYGSYVGDSVDEILTTAKEVGIMTKYGGGTSAYFGHLRPRGASISGGDSSFGPVYFMNLFQSVANIISQGSTRRGSFSPYLDVTHPDILEFLKIRSDGNELQDVSPGVIIPGWWMQEMDDGDINKREVMAAIHYSRAKSGFPYIVFSDNVRKGAPEVYQVDNSGSCPIRASNLCTEIFLPSNEDESFVCDLASMNIRYYDEWKDTDAVWVVTVMLDAVMSEFIEKASKINALEKAVRFATRHRALGIGWLGYHSYLQSINVPFESFEAKMLNVEIAKNIHDNAYAASHKLAEMFGSPEACLGTGRRNTTLLAIAPTKSSAFILGQVSEGVEPIRSNYFVDSKAKVKYSHRNKSLEALLETKEKNTEDVWLSILDKAGSVQHLEFLSEHEKNVYKTFGEISQREIIIQAGARQNFIDQGQSLNLMIDPETPVKDIHQLVLLAWKLGVKSLYYVINQSAAQSLSQQLTECSSCSA